MTKRLVSMIAITAAGVWALTGCDNNAAPTVDTSTINSSSAEIADKTSTLTTQSESADSANAKSTSTNTIDWTAIASDESPATLADYDYPFALDGESVRAYADYFNVDNATAQHNLTVSMASNEALSKVLDQVGSNYVAHELTDGKTVELILHTTPDFSASNYDYVLADNFGKGLVLPIVIKPDGQKGEMEGHGGLEE